MLQLLQITMVAITDRDHGKTIEALLKSLKLIQPFRTILFSDVYIERPEFETIVIPRLGSARAYNEFVTWKLGAYIESPFILLVQHDGYVINADAWTDEFLNYDYIGAPWTYTDGRNVGNGGFSLRSKRLHDILASDPEIKVGSPEDEIICRLYRGYLEMKHGITYAPEELACHFSFEMKAPMNPTFGFHNFFHKPWREPLILKRHNSMGDIIMLEPVMEYFHNQGYRIILDCLPQYFNLFYHHYFPVEHLDNVEMTEDTKDYRVINLDMSYETTPKQLVLKSYFQYCGVKLTDGVKLRNPKLITMGAQNKLFPKYALIHINKTDMPYRNIQFNGWVAVIRWLRLAGYAVFEIGNSGEIDTNYRIQAGNESMLAYIIGGADLFIGSDSGPAQIAVACGVKSVIFFGSVNPAYRFYDMTNIQIVQEPCDRAGCYHEVVGGRGQDCFYHKQKPPCTAYELGDVFHKINLLIQ